MAALYTSVVRHHTGTPMKMSARYTRSTAGRGAPATGVVDGVDQLALVVGLEVLDVQVMIDRGRRGRRHVVGEGLGAVHVRLTHAQQVGAGPESARLAALAALGLGDACWLARQGRLAQQLHAMGALRCYFTGGNVPAALPCTF